MTKYTGTGLYAKFGAQVLTSTYRTLSVSEEAGMVDQSAGADAARTYLTILDDGTVSMELLAEADGTDLWAAIAKGTEGSFEWAEEGTDTGNQKHTVNAIVKSRKKDVVYEDIVKISVEFQMSGAVTDTVY